jgi:hypothetical protein
LRAEVGERGSEAASSLTALAAGLILLPVGLALIFVALSLLLSRFVPLDLAFLIVAVVVIIVAMLFVWSGMRGLKPSRLVPAKSISQLSSLFGESRPWA